MKFLPPLPRTGLLLAALALASSSCGGDVDLVIYVAHDQIHSEPLVRRFEAETGLTVRAEYDVEANKTIGLVNRIREERNRTRCDVFWNNEIAHTVALAEEGLLASYDSPAAVDIPPTFRDREHRWTGFAARARIFIVNTDLVENPEDLGEIRGMWDLVDPRWAGKTGMARPLTGTTLTHAAALFSVLGEERAIEYLSRVKELNDEGQLNLVSGNGQLKNQVQTGALAWGWTDTDDYNVAREKGAPVTIIYPDQEGVSPDQEALGCLLIPNTVAILKEAPHPEAAQRFVDWLLSEEVEAELAHSRAAQIPVRASVPRPDHVIGGEQLKFMEVDFVEVGRTLTERQAFLKEMFLD
jgi:iron(III) transport system substrate-binding protein